MSDSSGKLKLGALVALVVGSMIGGGIFSLPQNMAASAGVGAVLIGWAITAVGMLTLAFVFQTLANRKPDLDGGVYAYAKAGFGDYMGFSSAWGYWISAWLGNVGYFVLLFSTLGYFFPIFGEGNTPAAIIGASVLLWAVHFLVLRGIKEAAFINLVTTVAKVVPLVLFALICLFAFRLDIFTADIWAVGTPDLGSVMNQVRNMMLVTVWVFIGIEGASIFSSRAEKRSDVGKATVIGFVTVLLFLVLVNVLSLGIMTQPELAKLQNPSMAAVLEHVVGHWGAVLISVGLIISLLGGPAVVGAAVRRDHVRRRQGPHHAGVPAPRERQPGAGQRPVADQRHGADLPGHHPVLQQYLPVADLPRHLDDSGALPVVGGYAFLLALRSETYEQALAERKKDLIIGAIALIYAIWLLYAGGVKYLLLSALLYAPGVILFAKAKREVGQPVFTNVEKLIFAAVVIGALVAAFGLYDGFLTL
jgi:arginine/ornithine antiporter